MEDREHWLAATMVELADTLVDDFDLVALLSTLVDRCSQLVGDAEVGLILDDQRGNLRPVASSTERMRLMELFETQRDQGPCHDSYRTGQQVTNCPLDDDAAQRWPEFTERATEAGFRMVHAVPLRYRDSTVGAVNVFQAVERPLDGIEVSLLQAMADTATIALLQDRAVSQATELAAQLQQALSSRVIIEQAKGVLAERWNLDIDGAFDVLRQLARARGKRLVEVAADVIDGEIDLEP